MAMSVWLATDFYDHSVEPNEISVTTLLKPLRELALLQQYPSMPSTPDVEGMVSQSIGTAIHMNIEQAWDDGRNAALEELGYPKKLIERMQVNPTQEELDDDPTIVPIYMERRTKREINGFIISGKFDFVAGGELTDFKSSTVYGWAKGNSVKKYVQQGSIYRWLNPDIITSDIMHLDWIFLDWNAGKAAFEKPYPSCRTPTEKHTMMSVVDTERFITNKLAQLVSLMRTPGQGHLPLCTKDELWQDDSVFKYYKDPNKTARSTKNFKTMAEASTRMATEGRGIIKEIPGTAKACKYCSAVAVCDQAKSLVQEGKLVM